MSMVATSASWGSFGSGVERRDCREMRADLMVRTGDHWEERVSRQIAPYMHTPKTSAIPFHSKLRSTDYGRWEMGILGVMG